MVIGTFAMANTTTVVKTSTKTNTIKTENRSVSKEDGTTTCQVRFCWNVSETERQCSDWVDVPCGKTITVQSQAINQA